MPMVNIDIFEGRTAEQKKALMKRVTEAFTETMGIPGEVVHVIIREMKREHYSEGGVPFSEK